MKKDKDKCKKGHESTIGKIIYGFLLFLPLFAITVTCGYVIFNKNAYQNYEAKQIEKFTRVSISNNLLIENRDYQITITQSFTNGTSIVYYNEIDPNFINTFDSNYTYVGFRLTGNANLVLIDSNEQTHSYWNYFTQPNAIKQWTFNYKSTNQPNNLINETQLYLIDYHKESLNHVFYTSIELVEQSNLFNWAENSIIYTGMTEFTTSLSITNTFIPLLLTYWLIISLVYFIYDIVLIIFNVLHRKIHELQDSI